MMRPGFFVSLFMFAAVTAGSFLFLGGSSSNLTPSLRRRSQETGEEEQLQGAALHFRDVNSLSPSLASYLIFTVFDSDEEKQIKRERFQQMVRYHTPMTPCLHKSFYGMIGFFNPSLTKGMSDEEKAQMVMFYPDPQGGGN
ncbi:expressed unknown protein [Seminavis robusta]|uniref:Uncharacterized protein n=1 Tax=Seminavis robusta TaxID=568900 RepID=A0A9N8DW33_9STRA|nr:expressed unknown protein [Seminavis robusta]|eukprot:Sro394_g133930.1 n/a (141) ;mRNA; f:59775-60197